MTQTVSAQLAALVLLASFARPSAAFASSPDDAAPDWRAADAAVDHRFTVPTAQTLAAGDVALNDYEILGLGASVGVTDWLEASFTTVVPYRGDMVSGLLGLKGRAYAGEVATVSAQVVVGGVLDKAFLVGGWVLADLHTADGVLALDSALGVAHSLSTNGDGSGWESDDASPFLVMSLGPTWRIDRHAALMVELEGCFSTHGLVNPGGFASGVDTLTINYGVRLHNQSVALDLAMLRPVALNWGQVWALGFPYVGVSVRF